MKTTNILFIAILLTGLLITAPVQARNWYDSWTDGDVIYASDFNQLTAIVYANFLKLAGIASNASTYNQSYDSLNRTDYVYTGNGSYLLATNTSLASTTYVGQVNTSMKNYVDLVNTSGNGYTDAVNSSMQDYVDGQGFITNTFNSTYDAKNNYNSTYDAKTNYNQTYDNYNASILARGYPTYDAEVHQNGTHTVAIARNGTVLNTTLIALDSDNYPVQAATDYLVALGSDRAGVLYMGTGAYSFSSPVTISKTADTRLGMRITGAGKGTRIYTGVDNLEGLFVIETDTGNIRSWEFDHIKFDGNGYALTAITFGNGAYGSIHDNLFTDFKQSTDKGCIYGTGYSWIVTNNQFYHTNTALYGDGINHLIFSDNMVGENMRGTAVKIMNITVSDGLDNMISGNNIHDCNQGGTNYYAIELSGSSRAVIKIQGNIIANFYGINISGVQYVNIDDNSFVTSTRTNSVGVKIISPSQVISLNNNYFGNYEDAILGEGDPHYIFARENTIDDVHNAGISGLGVGTILRDNSGFVTQNSSSEVLSDGGTISHGLALIPKTCFGYPSVAGEVVATTAKDATTCTFAIKNSSTGAAGTTQTIYWEAKNETF